ncbi:MAG: hypothetical protein Q7R65_02855 [bacterium]|nr:hypothetical protein [bacterium]
MSLIQFNSPDSFMIEGATKAFRGLMTDPEGREKYQRFLEAAKDKLRKIEYSLGQLAGKAIIERASFVSPLSDVRRSMEILESCFAAGWEGFNGQGTGVFGEAVSLESTLRAMTHSLGSYMIWHLPKEKEQSST